jgi:hypothetical protein
VGRATRISAVLVLLYVASGLRYNASGAVFACLWLLLFSLPHRQPRHMLARLARTGGAAVLLTGLLFVLATLNNRALTDHEDYAWQSVAVFDLVGIAAHEPDDDPSVRDLMATLDGMIIPERLSASAIHEVYSPRQHATIFRSEHPLFVGSASPVVLARLRSAWLAAITAHPTAYLRHRASVFLEAIGASPKSTWAPVYVQPFEGSVPQQLGHDYRLSRLQRGIGYLLEVVGRTVLFRPVLYFLLALAGLFVGWRRLRSSEPLVFFLLMSGVMYELTLFVAAPSVDYRYSHWLVLSCWSACLLVAGRRAAHGRRGRLHAPDAS